MKKIAFFFLVLLVIVLVGCNNSKTKNNDLSSKDNLGETSRYEKTEATVPVKEVQTKYCFYVKDAAIYFVESKSLNPIKLTEQLVTADWYDTSSVRALASTVFCKYDEEYGKVFYSDYGANNLYYRDIDNPSESVHITDGISSAATRYILNKSTIYYTTGHLELYEYDMTTGKATFIDNQVTGVDYSESSDIVYTKNSGERYSKNVGEKAIPYNSDSSIAKDGFDKSSMYREIAQYDSGERYYLKLGESANEVILCYWDGKTAHEIYRHKKANYYAVGAKNSPAILISFPSYSSESQKYNGKILLAVKDRLITISDKGVDGHFIFNNDETQVFYLEDDGNNSYSLCYQNIDSSSLGEAKTFATGVGKIDDGFYWNDEYSGTYFIKVDLNNKGYLYYDNMEVDSEWLNGVSGMWDQQLLYKTNPRNDTYTLKAAVKGNSSVIKDGVYNHRKQYDSLWMIADYNNSTESGKLYLYNDDTSAFVDSDVIQILSEKI